MKCHHQPVTYTRKSSKLTDISDEPHKSVSKLVPRLILGPNEQDSSYNGRYKMMQPPPAFDSRPVDFKDAFTYRECAVVPDKQEYQDKLEWPEMGAIQNE